MYLKRVLNRIQTNIYTSENEKENAAKFILVIIRNLHNPIVWPWKTKDHILLLRHFDQITDKIIFDKNIDIQIARNTIINFVACP